jgi:cytochrome c556
MRNVVLALLTSALLTTTVPAQDGPSNRALTKTRQKRTAPTPDSPFKLAASVQQLMTAITIPASDVIFEAAAQTTKEAAWLNIQNSALTLAESGNLLLLPGRVPDGPDNDEWVNQSRAMIDAAILAFNAAATKNVEQLSEAGDKIYATCEGCHKKYMH